MQVRLTESIPTDTPDPEVGLLQQERLARLNALVSELDADKRELLALRFAGGLSAREIALVVDKSQAAVKKQLTRTIETLREHYDEKPS